MPRSSSSETDKTCRRSDRRSDRRLLKKILRQIKCLKKHVPVPCDQVTHITARDLQTPQASYAIDCQGNYCLSETVTWCPPSNLTNDPVTDIALAAIVINADNVFLDLSKHTLIQGNTVPQMVGIQIKSGHQNVYIYNGSVENCTYMGIYAEGGTSFIYIGSCNSVTRVTGCGFGQTYSFYDVANQFYTTPAGICIGESLTEFTYFNGPVQTVRMHNVFAEGNGPNGMFLGVCQDTQISQCSFSYNIDNRIGYPFDEYNTTYASGMLYEASVIYGDLSSTDVQLINCRFDGNASSGNTQQVAGLYMGYNIDGLTIQHCSFDSNVGTTSGTPNTEGGGTYGCVLAGNTGVTVDDCSSSNNSSPFLTYGFHNSGASDLPAYVDNAHGIVWRRCIASGNSVSGDGKFAYVQGFYSAWAHGFAMEQCMSYENTASTTSDTTLINAYGILITGAVNPEDPAAQYQYNGLITGCQCSGNTVTVPRGSGSSGSGIGIGITAPTYNIVVQDCVIQGNGGGNNNAGVYTNVSSSETNNPGYSIVVQDCTIMNQANGISSNGDTGGIYQRNTITNVTTGVALNGSSCCTVKDNYVSLATNGVTDSTVPSSSLVGGNTTFGTTTPFSVTYAFGPVPVLTGSLDSGFPSAPANALQNIAISSSMCSGPISE